MKKLTRSILKRSILESKYLFIQLPERLRKLHHLEAYCRYESGPICSGWISSRKLRKSDFKDLGDNFKWFEVFASVRAKEKITITALRWVDSKRNWFVEFELFPGDKLDPGDRLETSWKHGHVALPRILNPHCVRCKKGDELFGSDYND